MKVESFAKFAKRKVDILSTPRRVKKNLKVSAFQDHQSSNEYRRLNWALYSGDRVIEKAIKQAQQG